MIAIIAAYKAAIMKDFDAGLLLSFAAGICSYFVSIPAIDSADKVITLLTHLVQLGIAGFGLLTAFYAFLGFRRKYRSAQKRNKT